MELHYAASAERLGLQREEAASTVEEEGKLVEVRERERNVLLLLLLLLLQLRARRLQTSRPLDPLAITDLWYENCSPT
jgi:hypothetical protein